MEESKPQVPSQPEVNSDEQPDDSVRDVVQPPKSKRDKWLWLGLGFAVLVAGAAYWLVTKDEPQPAISSYEQCVAAGYPVMESYPEQCAVPGGQSFTRQLSEEEQAALENKSSGFDTESPLITDLPEGEAIELSQPGDENKLPDVTPDSFVIYIKGILASNDVDDGCISLYRVARISAVNISGGTGSVNPATLNESLGEEAEPLCGGGAAQFWYLKNGQWDVLGLQDGPNCETLSATTIYSEFIPTCFDDSLGETDGNGAYGQRPNPNGSIDDAQL